MSEPLTPKNARVVRIGPDRVTVTDNEVVIEARNEIPDWNLQAMNTPAIYFEDRKYFLAEISSLQPPFAMRYVLRPWPAGRVANPRVFHVYNEEAVRERDGNRRSEVVNEVVWVCLLPLYPVLGMLWSRTQQRLVRFGFLPRTITGISIFMVFGLLLSQGAFIALLLMASARSGTMMIGGMIRAALDTNYIAIGPVNVPVAIFDALLAFAFLADLAIRYTNYLRDEEWTGGFFEWLMPRWLRRKQPVDRTF